MDDVVERLRWEFDLANVDRDVDAIVAVLMAGEMPNHFPTIARILSRKTTSVLDSSARRAAKRCLGAGIETAMGRPNESSAAMAIAVDRDVAVRMRDGVTIVVDVYRPDAPGAFPVLLAFATQSKEIQGTDYPKTFPPQPAWSSLWVGHMEAGDTRFFVTRGYVHVIGSPRGVGKSGDGGSRLWDSYDLIQWIAAQPWCNGEVGMVGIGAFAAEQFHAARQRPPHLKAIFPYDPRGVYGAFGGFREEYPGGVMHAFRYLQDHFSGAHLTKGAPGELPPEREQLWREAMDGEPGLSDVSPSLPSARPQVRAHAEGFRCAARSL